MPKTFEAAIAKALEVYDACLESTLPHVKDLRAMLVQVGVELERQQTVGTISGIKSVIQTWINRYGRIAREEPEYCEACSTLVIGLLHIIYAIDDVPVGLPSPPPHDDFPRPAKRI